MHTTQAKCISVTRSSMIGLRASEMLHFSLDSASRSIKDPGAGHTEVLDDPVRSPRFVR